MMTRIIKGYYQLNEQNEYKLSFVSSVTLMDNDGNVLDQKKYNEHGELVEKYTSIYSENGLMLTSRIEYLSNGSEDSTENVYNDKDQLILSVNSFYDGSVHNEHHNYSKEDNRVETIVYDQNEQLLWRIEFKFDDLNNLIEETEFDENGIELSKVLYEYLEDKKNKESIYIDGNLSSCVHFSLSANGTVNSITTVNELGNVIDKSLYIKTKEGSVVIFQLDGKEISEECYYQKTVYDKNELLLFMSTVNEGIREEVVFEYDSLDRITKEYYVVSDSIESKKSMIKYVYEEL